MTYEMKQKKVIKAAELLMEMMDTEGYEFFGYNEESGLNELYDIIEDIAYNAEMMIEYHNEKV